MQGVGLVLEEEFVSSLPSASLKDHYGFSLMLSFYQIVADAPHQRDSSSSVLLPIPPVDLFALTGSVELVVVLPFTYPLDFNSALKISALSSIFAKFLAIRLRFCSIALFTGCFIYIIAVILPPNNAHSYKQDSLSFFPVLAAEGQRSNLDGIPTAFSVVHDYRRG